MKQEGLDDMTLLAKVNNDEICSNLKMRYDKDIIYVRKRFIPLYRLLSMSSACSTLSMRKGVDAIHSPATRSHLVQICLLEFSYRKKSDESLLPALLPKHVHAQR